MATIDSKAIIDRIIAHGGQEYADEPPAVKIVEYTNAWGGRCWGVVFANESPAMQVRYEIPTEYVREPRVIWRRTSTYQY